MENKRAGIILIGIVIVILLIGGFFVFWDVNKEKIRIECESDSDCVRMQTTCCPCNMGGEEKCVPLSEKDEIGKRLDNCSEDILCAAVYNCIKAECGCVNGKCMFNE